MAKANTNGTTTGPTSASGRNSVSRASFKRPDGSYHRSPSPDWTELRIEVFTGERDKEGKPVVRENLDFPRSEVPEDVFNCAAGHGLKQKIGDEFSRAAGIAKDTGESIPDIVVQRAMDMWDNLKSGVWVSESEGGAGNLTVLLEAITRALAGTPDAVVVEGDEEATAANKARLLKKLSDDEKWRADARKHTTVAFHVKTIEAERAAKRLAAAKEAMEKAAATEAAPATSLAF